MVDLAQRDLDPTPAQGGKCSKATVTDLRPGLLGETKLLERTLELAELDIGRPQILAHFGHVAPPSEGFEESSRSLIASESRAQVTLPARPEAEVGERDRLGKRSTRCSTDGQRRLERVASRPTIAECKQAAADAVASKGFTGAVVTAPARQHQGPPVIGEGFFDPAQIVTSLRHVAQGGSNGRFLGFAVTATLAQAQSRQIVLECPNIVTTISVDDPNIAEDVGFSLETMPKLARPAVGRESFAVSEELAVRDPHLVENRQCKELVY